MRDAQNSGVIPWSWNKSYYHCSPKFLANPEIVLTPDIFLLPWIPNSIFVIIHVIIMYSIGFFGSILIAKKLHINLIAFLLFWLVFNFNGYLTSHLAVGHFQWTGYLVLPFFFIILIRLIKESNGTSNRNIRLSICMALLLGFLFLNGSLHIAVWCCIFMLITLLFRWAIFKNIFIAISLGLLLGFGRLLPAAIWFQIKGENSFLPGYWSPGNILEAFTSFHRHDFLKITLGWWNYNFYIGLFAFIILMICFAFALNRRRVASLLPLLIASSFFLLFSFGNIYNFFIPSNLPFVNVERVPSRFIAMPFILFLIIATKGIDEIFSFWPKSSRVIATLVLPLVVIELIFHSSYWRIEHLEKSFQVYIRPILSLVPNMDPTYAFFVYASWSISIVTLIIIAVILFRYRPGFNLTSNEQDLLI